MIFQYPSSAITSPPVWRGERPQKGRYREFVQCDVDIVGVNAMSADAEIIAIQIAIFKRLGFQDFVVRINNRKLLTAIGIYSGVSNPDQLAQLYRSIDKFDKIGADGVQQELTNRDIDSNVAQKIMALITANPSDPLKTLAQTLADEPNAQSGIQELQQLQQELHYLGVEDQFYDFDFTMVRGLGYYTGPIFEMSLRNGALGSISGGGRYDDLIGMFRRQSLPTTGASLGIERILDLMDDLALYPPNLNATVVQVMVLPFDEDTRPQALRIAAEIRDAGIHTECYLQKRALNKQLKYAHRKGVPLVIIPGPDELASDQVTLRRLRDGHEETIPRNIMIDRVHTLLKSN